MDPTFNERRRSSVSTSAPLASRERFGVGALRRTGFLNTVSSVDSENLAINDEKKIAVRHDIDDTALCRVLPRLRRYPQSFHVNTERSLNTLPFLRKFPPSLETPPSTSTMPIWARRERLMQRHHTIKSLTRGESSETYADHLKHQRQHFFGIVGTLNTPPSSTPFVPFAASPPNSPWPYKQIRQQTLRQVGFACMKSTSPFSESNASSAIYQPSASSAETLLIATDSLQRMRPVTRNLLHAPSPLDVGLMAGELPPHRKDTVEKIPIRARSQSWLIRTRHLLDDEKNRRTPIISNCLYVLSIVLLILTFPFSLFACIRIAKEYERAVVFRLGRLIKRGTKGPGIFFVMPCIDTYKVVDLRVLSFDVPPQEILSRDSVTVSVEAVIYFRISNPVISVTNVNDAQFSTKLLAQTTLRNVLGTKTLSEILMERDNISSITEKVLDDGTDPWGVKVQRVEIKDIRLPHQLMRSMAAEAEAARDARARVIAADGERNASRSLVQAADAMNKVALNLRYLQTLSHVAAERNRTIVIPFPIEVAHIIVKRIKLWRKSCD